ncbi:OLC1v1023081C1 [Oldenlandia corymbosa var. corymbosa]|uniref:OLC1v1023081C1 n=1 Tax=Oldenlandia corymbosa var. corymbosa TaxID=529605 RepID=A0AAV1C242_OLDCO|nr:OLC1v1023081C1 [Oldenlandia corymbosa var. corymbosa]
MDSEMEETIPFSQDKDNPFTTKVKNKELNNQSANNQQDPAVPHPSNTPWVDGAPSFRDRLLKGQNNQTVNGFHMIKVTVREGDLTYSEEDGVPSTMFSDRVKHQMVVAMTYTIAVKPLGKEFRYDRLFKRFKGMWKPKGDIKHVDTIEGYHLYRVTNEEDFYSILLNAPWSLDETYIRVLPWNKGFNYKEDNLTAVPTWIRIPGLPVDYFHEDLLRSLIKPLGRYIKADKNTLAVERGKYARLTVELDLTKPSLGKTKIDGIEYNIEYEDLQKICFTCGKYGHLKNECSLTPTTSPATNPMKTETLKPTSMVGPSSTDSYDTARPTQHLHKPLKTPTVREWSHAIKKEKRYVPSQGQSGNFSKTTPVAAKKDVLVNPFAALAELEKDTHEGSSTSEPTSQAIFNWNKELPTSASTFIPNQNFNQGKGLKPGTKQSMPKNAGPKNKAHQPTVVPSKRKPEQHAHGRTWIKKSTKETPPTREILDTTKHTVVNIPHPNPQTQEKTTPTILNYTTNPEKDSSQPAKPPDSYKTFNPRKTVKIKTPGLNLEPKGQYDETIISEMEESGAPPNDETMLLETEDPGDPHRSMAEPEMEDVELPPDADR